MAKQNDQEKKKNINNTFNTTEKTTEFSNTDSHQQYTEIP